jgi:GNAT superfamily N-acetyltransferase
VDAFLAAYGTEVVARLDELVDARRHPALIAETEGRLLGVLTWIVTGHSLEVLTLHAAERWTGVGTALLGAALRVAEAAGCRRLWLITTNDNTDALRFYQRRGLRLVCLHAGAVGRARATLKPWIPELGEHGIPIRDELELELELDVAGHGPGV